MKATILVATTIKEFEREHVRSQKLSTDVRKRFRQVVNSLENRRKYFVTKIKNNLIFLFRLFLRHEWKYVVVNLLKINLMFALVT